MSKYENNRRSVAGSAVAAGMVAVSLAACADKAPSSTSTNSACVEFGADRTIDHFSAIGCDTSFAHIVEAAVPGEDIDLSGYYRLPPAPIDRLGLAACTLTVEGESSEGSHPVILAVQAVDGSLQDQPMIDTGDEDITYGAGSLESGYVVLDDSYMPSVNSSEYELPGMANETDGGYRIDITLPQVPAGVKFAVDDMTVWIDCMRRGE